MQYAKKILATFLLFSAIFVAKPSRAEIPSFGLQGGVAFSDLEAAAGFSADSITGFAGGVLLEIPLNVGISIQPEALFVQRGAVVAGSGASNVSISYSVLEVPVFAKLKVGTVVQPYFLAGPLFSFTLSHSVNVEAGGTMGSLTFDPRTFDFGVAFGGGVEIGPFFANLRYELGVVELDENSGNWQSRGFLILAGLKL